MVDLVVRARAARSATEGLTTRSSQSVRLARELCQTARRLRRHWAGSVYAADDAAGPLRVLLVDDYEAVRTSFASVLRAAGFEVIEASDSFQAIEALRLLRFDAVVLDLEMPNVDGVGVLERVSDLPPVILLTGHGYGPSLFEHRDRIFRFAGKPIASQFLITLVGEAATAGRASAGNAAPVPLPETTGDPGPTTDAGAVPG